MADETIKTPTPTAKDDKADKATKTVKLDPVYAIHKINGTIEPGTIFTPESADQDVELRQLEAVRDLTDDEAVLFGAKSDPLG